MEPLLRACAVPLVALLIVSTPEAATPPTDGVYCSGDMFGAGAISVHKLAANKYEIQVGYINNNAKARAWPAKRVHVDESKSVLSFEAVSGLDEEGDYQSAAGTFTSGVLRIRWAIGEKRTVITYKFCGKRYEFQGEADDKPKVL